MLFRSKAMQRGKLENQALIGLDEKGRALPMSSKLGNCVVRAKWILNSLPSTGLSPIGYPQSTRAIWRGCPAVMPWREFPCWACSPRPCTAKWRSAYARPRYWPERVSTLIVSPSSMNSGTPILNPASRKAVFITFVAELPRTPGAVSAIFSVTLAGNSISMALPL